MSCIDIVHLWHFSNLKLVRITGMYSFTMSNGKILWYWWLKFVLSQGHKKWITALSWEPLHLKAPCRRFVSSSKDGDARIWDISTRKSVICLSGHTLAVTCVKWGGDGVIYTGYVLISWNFLVLLKFLWTLDKPRENFLYVILKLL